MLARALTTHTHTKREEDVEDEEESIPTIRSHILSRSAMRSMEVSGQLA